MFEKGKAVLVPLRERGVRDVVRSVLQNPGLIYRQFTGRRGFTKHRKEGPVSPQTLARFISSLTGVPTDDAIRYWIELHNDDQFRTSLERNLHLTNAGPNKLYHNWRELLYVLIRVVEPSVVVETGVADGLSASYILAALAANDSGTLVSIDLGDTKVVPWDLDQRQIGWVVPAYLHDRWDLRFGDSTVLLPEVLQVESPDIFFSDVPNHLLESELEMAAEHMIASSYVVSSYPQDGPAQNQWNSYAETHLQNIVTAPRALYQDTESVTCAGKLR
jgi:hypothetical protein